jgi:hypothetical protein
MDVHPAKNVSIGIDPYPYINHISYIATGYIGYGINHCLRELIGSNLVDIWLIYG